MGIEIFSKEEFEKALPVHKKTGEKLWYYGDIIGNEHIYYIPIPNSILSIKIRSSVKGNGFCADSGKDSIRCWLINEEGKPHGSKVDMFTTRISGWEERMLKKFRILWKRALGTNKCPVCNRRKAIYKNKGKRNLFQACPIHFATTTEDWKD